MENDGDDLLEDIYASVISRALYHFQAMEKLEEDMSDNFFGIIDYAFHLRSFIEITTALPLWFKHPYYTADLPAEGLRDLVENFSWLARRMGNGINVMALKDENNNNLLDMVENFNAMMHENTYSLEIGKTKVQREKDPFYAESFKFLSKIIHADEYSILLTSQILNEIVLPKKLISYLGQLKRFWLKQFHFELYDFNLNRNKAKINIQKLYKLPFDISVNPYD